MIQNFAENSQALTKESFWDNIQEKYPKSFKIFSDWIDRYKKDVNWDAMFNAVLNIKFHELPYRFQYGVIRDFFAEQGYLFWVTPAFYENGKISWYWEWEILKHAGIDQKKAFDFLEVEYLKNNYNFNYRIAAEMHIYEVMFKVINLKEEGLLNL